MKLFYRSYGSGTPLIILHGLYGSSDNWVSVAHKLKDECMVILPDMRNHGHSPWADTHSYEDMSHDVEELIESLGLSKVFIAGHSMGGKTAIRFTVDNPEKVKGLFIGDISPFPYPANDEISGQHRNILNTICSVNPEDFKSRDDLAKHLIPLVGEKTTNLVLLKNITIEKGVMKWRLNARVLLANIDSYSEGFSEKYISGRIFSDLPVILLKGERSKYVSESDMEKIKKIFPLTDVRVAEQCGHWIHTDCPDAVVDALKTLLKSGENK
ncbi:MAG TPA: alpha/beta fold hydrolase [Bacteroidales bacterium]|nr:alpha/beta fold hydrolase [Bacteroidales bacterium]